MRLAPLACVLALLAVPGCASLSEGVAALRQGDVAVAPWYNEWRVRLEGQHASERELAVSPGASLLNVTLRLETRQSGLGAAAPTPARLDISLVDPAGKEVATGTVDPANPNISLVVERPAPGEYRVHIAGYGASSAVPNTDVGASYLLSAEILYG